MTHGEKKDTSPAMRATGTARTNDPAAACSWNHSPTGLTGDVLVQAHKGSHRGELAEDGRGDASLVVEHEGRRRGPHRDDLGEGQQRLAVGVVDRGVRHVEGPHERPGVV